jgi:hypothetical protein
MAMNGTGGVWRVAAIRDAGDWSADTLTEDLDLSYRAYLNGWDFLFLLNVHAPGEIPPFIPIFKMQQARWAAGSTQNLFKLGLRLLMSPRPSLLGKFMGLMHLCQYVVQPIILLLFLLTPLLLVSGSFQLLPDLSLLAIMSLIPPLIVTVSQVELYEQGWKHLAYFPAQFIVSAAIVLNNSAAVLMAFTHYNKQFRRTPKFSISREHNTLSANADELYIDATTYGELLLAGYAAWGTIIALNTYPALVPYMLTYGVASLTFAISTFIQVRSQRRHTAESQASSHQPSQEQP